MDEILECLAKKLWPFIKSRLNEENEAKEILNDVLMTVNDNIEQLRDEKALYAWAMVIAKRKIFKKWKKIQKKKEKEKDNLLDNDIPDVSNAPYNKLCLSELEMLLIETLYIPNFYSDIELKIAKIFIPQTISNVKHEEIKIQIIQTLNISDTYLRVILYRVRQKLELFLSEKGYGKG